MSPAVQANKAEPFDIAEDVRFHPVTPHVVVRFLEPKFVSCVAPVYGRKLVASTLEDGSSMRAEVESS